MQLDYVTIRPYAKTLETWVEEMGIPDGERKQILGADVVILPIGYRDSEHAFAHSAYDFMAYAREKQVFSIEMCSTDNQFSEIELCSLKTRLGRFFVPAAISGTLFWGVLCNYIYDQIRPILPQFTPVEVVESQHYLDAPEVSFSIVIPDSLGNKQEIEYDGPVEGIDKVGEIIKTLTNGNGFSDTATEPKE